MRTLKKVKINDGIQSVLGCESPMLKLTFNLGKEITSIK